MAQTATTIRIGGLGKTKLAALQKQAKRMGMTIESYVRQLIEESLRIERRAQTTTFDELFAPVQDEFKRSGMIEAELDDMVDAARTRHHRRTSGKKN